MTTLPTPAELREIEDHVRDCTHCRWCRPETREEILDALRQFASLIESIDRIHRMAINKNDMITADAIMMIKRGEIVS